MTVVPDQHRRASELLGAFVLHAVDPEEAELVERHLERCLHCQGEVDQLREVAAAIGNSAEPPSAALWDRIAAQLGDPEENSRSADAVPLAAMGIDRGAVALVELPRVGATADTKHRLLLRGGRARGSRSHRRVWTMVGVGAAAACAAAAAVFGVNWSDANGRVGELQTALAQRGVRSAVAAALDSPGHRVVDLRSTGGAHLAEFVVRRNGGGYVVSSRMAALPNNETYQLWAKIDDQPISLGLLGAEPKAGDAFSLGSSVGDATELMVTVEPSGGVVTPTSSPVGAGTLSVG